MSPLDTERLKALRQKRGLSQRDLAKAAGLHQPRLVELENGKRANITVSTLERLAVALGVEPGELLVREKRKRGR